MGLLRSIVAANLGMVCTAMCKLWGYRYTDVLIDEYFPLHNRDVIYLLLNVNPSNGSIIGAIVAYLLLDTIGRKATLLCSVLPLSVGCLLSMTYSTFLELAFGQAIAGIGVGINLVSIPLYFSEIARDSNRGAVGISACLGYTIGDLISCLLSRFFHSRIYLMASFALILLFFVNVVYASESPYYAVLCRENEKARRELIEIRGPTINVDEEMEMIKKIVKDESLRKKGILSCLTGGNVMMFVTMGLLTTVQHCTGNLTTQIYSGLTCSIVFSRRICDKYLDIAVALVQILCYVMCMFKVDRCGRRFLLVMSACGAAVGNLFLASHIQLSTHDYPLFSLDVIVISGFVIYLLTFNIGLSSIPTLMIGELFSIDGKIKAACIFRIVADLNPYVYLLLYAVFRYRMYPDLFYIFFGCAFLALFMILLFVPKADQNTLERMHDASHRTLILRNLNLFNLINGNT